MGVATAIRPTSSSSQAPWPSPTTIELPPGHQRRVGSGCTRVKGEPPHALCQPLKLPTPHQHRTGGGCMRGCWWPRTGRHPKCGTRRGCAPLGGATSSGAWWPQCAWLVSRRGQLWLCAARVGGWWQPAPDPLTSLMLHAAPLFVVFSVALLRACTHAPLHPCDPLCGGACCVPTADPQH